MKRKHWGWLLILVLLQGCGGSTGPTEKSARAKIAAELDKWLESKYDEATYYLPTLRPASENVHVSENTGQPEWYTPQKFIDAARTVLGEIDLE